MYTSIYIYGADLTFNYFTGGPIWPGNFILGPIWRGPIWQRADLSMIRLSYCGLP